MPLFPPGSPHVTSYQVQSTWPVPPIIDFNPLRVSYIRLAQVQLICSAVVANRTISLQLQLPGVAFIIDIRSGITVTAGNGAKVNFGPEFPMPVYSDSATSHFITLPDVVIGPAGSMQAYGFNSAGDILTLTLLVYEWIAQV